MKDGKKNACKQISVIIPFRNEEKYLKKLINSLKEQSYPHDALEIIFVDGNSTDNSLLVINESIKDTDIKILVIENPQEIIPAAMNLGIEQSTGEYIVRLDAHAEYNIDYISSGIKIMEQKKELVSVGGYAHFRPSSQGSKAFVTCAVFISRLGTGSTSIRVNHFTKFEDKYVDTALYGIFRKRQLKEINGYNEELAVSQDIELFDRLKKEFKGKIWITNQMKIIYYFKPNTGMALFKRQFRISKWTFQRKTGIRIRHLLPLLSGIIGIFLILFKPLILVPVLFIYAVLTMYFYALETTNVKELLYLFYATYVFFMNHSGYFLGSLVSLANKCKQLLVRRRRLVYDK
jgi:glycosyltransferase involved in cell wall biosynthesis